MRKTSQDGADSTSIASGLDNELKKPSTSTNKVKKNSIKRKVPNFSHDSDDAIIEPLLQTEKDNSVIANKSAKYLLNKSKTESLYEKDTKSFENPKVSTPVSISNNVPANIMAEKRTSPLTSESPPIYNHMNTNVFSGYDLTKEKTTTSNSILVEIDGCKAIGQGSNPVIFTTAKIHTDTKTKVIEPVQVTPVPILSTIEGNVVKSGVIYEDNKRYSMLQTNKGDISKNANIKTDIKLETSNYNDLSHMKVIPGVAPSSTIHVKNEQNINKELQSMGPSEKSGKIFSKDQKVSLTKIANSSDQKSSMPKVTSNETTMTKIPPNIESVTYKTNGVIPDTSKELTKTINKPNMLDKNNVTEKSKPSSDMEKINANQITQPSTSSSKQNVKSNVNVKPQADKNDTVKNFSSSIKKLQRQKNATIDELKETVNKDLSNLDKDNTSSTMDKGISIPVTLKSDTKTIQKPSTPMTTVATKCTSPIVTSELPSKSLNSTTTSPSTCKPPLISAGTSGTLNNKPSTSIDITQTKCTSSKIPEPSGKLATKPLSNIPTVVTTATSTKTSTGSGVKSMNVTDDKPSLKQDNTSVSILPSKTVKTESTTTSSVGTSLPLYIVSTSKTKIGSSLTPSISTVTKKVLDQKPVTEVVSTANGKSGKVLMSTSQSSQSGSKPKITNVNLVKKDDRA